jgi:hypothetical protein
MIAPEVLSVSVTACPDAVWLYAPGTGKKTGVAAAGVGVTVRVSVVVMVKLPEVPVMVTVAVPVVAALLAARVKVLLPVVLVGLKPAVTPLGRPEADKLTVPVKPFCGVAVMVLVPLAP